MAGCFILIVFLLALLIVFGALSLPHGVVGWAAVCNCGISWSYLFSFCGTLHMIVFFLFLKIYLIIVIITLSY